MHPPLDQLVACHECDLLLPRVKLAPRHNALCPRCRCTILRKTSDSFEKTLVLSATGLLLYLPAIFLPLLTAALFPLVLLSCCFFLSLCLYLGSTWPKTAWLMRLFQHLEKRAMLEIFLLAILITIIKMSGNTDIVYNSGMFCFIGLVLATVTMNSVVDRDKFWRTIESPGAQPEWLDWSPDIVLLELEKSRHLVPAE